MAVTLGFTGVGGRGGNLLETCLGMDDVAVPAVCDALEANRERASDLVVDSGRPAPDSYASHGDLLARDDLDGVVIATPWHYHIPMAVDAMEAGVDAAIEVGPASSVEECRELVETAEATGRQCMLLENHCFRRRMMAVLEMVRRGCSANSSTAGPVTGTTSGNASPPGRGPAGSSPAAATTGPASSRCATPTSTPPTRSAPSRSSWA